MKKSLGFLLVFFLCSCSTNRILIDQPVLPKYKYEMNLDDYEDDKISIKLSLNNFEQETATFCFPKIVPGIYGKMNFGQFIKSILITDTKGIKSQPKRIDVNCWEVENLKQISSIEYEVDDSWEVFNFEMEDGFYKSASTTFQKEVFLINNNCLFGYFQGLDNIPIELVVSKSENIYGATSLQKVESNLNYDKFEVKDYHELVDNPIMYSAPDTSLIKLPNIDVEVACYSSTKQSISKEIANYIKPLLINQTEYLGGELPIDKYTFILYHNLNPDLNSWMGDGLEHSNSTLILLYMPLDLDIIKENVYGIASHEFFHTLMPLGIHSHEIANYDFNNPKFSRHLWLYEGTTEYFTIHMPIKNGLQEISEFTKVLERIITEMKSFDNQLSMTDLSLNAMDYQDQYYNVYLKGTIINLCLDIKLREISNGAYGVQNLILDLLSKYGIDKSFDDENLFNEIVSITGFPALIDFFDRYVDGTEKLPLEAVSYTHLTLATKAKV